MNHALPPATEPAPASDAATPPLPTQAGDGRAAPPPAAKADPVATPPTAAAAKRVVKKPAKTTANKAAKTSAVRQSAIKPPVVEKAAGRSAPGKAKPTKATKAAVSKPAAPVPAPAPVKSEPPRPAGKAAKRSSKARAPLVRDSFTMPEADFRLIAALKAKALDARRAAKKSELLRAGLQMLSGLEAKALVAALDALEPVQVGRPKKGH